MRQVQRFIFCLAFNVGMLLTLNDLDMNLVNNMKKIPDTTTPTELLSFTIPEEVKIAFTERGCYRGLSMCYEYHRDKLKYEVCGYHPNFKLVNFANLCDLYLQNCLFEAEKDARKPHVPDPFYYNKRERNCQYYFQNGSTYEDAVKLYHLDVIKPNNHVKI